jgi:hypothetical protein
VAAADGLFEPGARVGVRLPEDGDDLHHGWPLEQGDVERVRHGWKRVVRRQRRGGKTMIYGNLSQDDTQYSLPYGPHLFQKFTSDCLTLTTQNNDRKGGDWLWHQVYAGEATTTC